MKSFEEIKKDMVKLIQANLPMEFERSEADSFYGIVVDKSGKITGTGYAEGYCAKKLDGLSIEDLATKKPTSDKEYLEYQKEVCSGCRMGPKVKTYEEAEKIKCPNIPPKKKHLPSSPIILSGVDMAYKAGG
jgi:hypothetical protein